MNEPGRTPTVAEPVERGHRVGLCLECLNDAQLCGGQLSQAGRLRSGEVEHPGRRVGQRRPDSKVARDGQRVAFRQGGCHEAAQCCDVVRRSLVLEHVRVDRLGDEVQHQDRPLGIVVAPAREQGRTPRPRIGGHPLIQAGLNRERAVGADLASRCLLEEEGLTRAAVHPEVAVPARNFLDPEPVEHQRGEVEQAETEEVGDARFQGQLRTRPGDSRTIMAALRVPCQRRSCVLEGSTG